MLSIIILVGYAECLVVTRQSLAIKSMRLCHPPDGNTSAKYKLLCFITTKKICKEKNTLAFNWDRCCHLVLCLRLIPFHCAEWHYAEWQNVWWHYAKWYYTKYNGVLACTKKLGNCNIQSVMNYSV
jgi:hypothetical protein